MTEQMSAQMDKQRECDDTLRAEMEKLREREDMLRAEMEQLREREDMLRAEMEKLREEAVEARVRAEMQTKLDGAQQLRTLQVRLEALHQAKLLTDDELYVVEDAIADSEDTSQDDHVPTLIALSIKMTSDRAFARQLKRQKWL